MSNTLSTPSAAAVLLSRLKWLVTYFSLCLLKRTTRTIPSFLYVNPLKAFFNSGFSEFCPCLWLVDKACQDFYGLMVASVRQSNKADPRGGEGLHIVKETRRQHQHHLSLDKSVNLMGVFILVGNDDYGRIVYHFSIAM